MVDWNQVLSDAVKIRAQFVKCLSEKDAPEPEAVIAAALSIIYETTYIYEADFTADFPAFSSLGLFLVDHSKEGIKLEHIHGQLVFVADCGETFELSESVIEGIERLNYIR